LTFNIQASPGLSVRNGLDESRDPGQTSPRTCRTRTLGIYIRYKTGSNTDTRVNRLNSTPYGRNSPLDVTLSHLAPLNFLQPQFGLPCSYSVPPPLSANGEHRRTGSSTFSQSTMHRGASQTDNRGAPVVSLIQDTGLSRTSLPPNFWPGHGCSLASSSGSLSPHTTSAVPSMGQ
jgi:hypothetical protein